MKTSEYTIVPVLFFREQRCLADAASSPEDHPQGLGVYVRERSVRRAHCGCVVDPAMCEKKTTSFFRLGRKLD